MPKQKLFDEEEEEEKEVEFKLENEYAKKYDKWREKEELHKLEQKYGSKALNSDVSASSDSEDESDDPLEVSEETEAQFLKTLSLLKTKDPRIYDSKFEFFDDKEQKQTEEKKEKKTLTFEDSDEDDDDNDGNIFKIEEKAIIDREPEQKLKRSSKEAKIKEYLTGKADHIDEEVEKDLAPLKALWSDPKLNEGEAFLRDYILNKRYLEDGDVGEAGDRIRDDDELEEDEKTVEEQGKFERAYNFRFEEPDDEYLKRFPRTMNYMRPKDDRRSRKRAELRARKEEEKRKKMEEIARLKALKLKEIQEKIAKIKEVTGNEQLAFQDEDIEGDFDPDEHDRRMKAIFDEQFYGEADTEKPVFPDLDEELEIENWDNYIPGCDDDRGDSQEDGPHCEDQDFNMDADYDPKQARTNLLEELKRNMGKKRRNRKRKSKLADLLSKEKPTFVPTVAEKTYNEYMEEYYKMDCEDVIGGDLPTRFKYREVVPNDYGLTIEEILLADDKELTQWVPLKKIVKYRPANAEKGDINTYKQKAADASLKKKVLPSLFKDLPEEPEIVVPAEEAVKKKKKKKKEKKKDFENETNNLDENEDIKHENNGIETVNDKVHSKDDDTNIIERKSKKKKHKHIAENNNFENVSQNFDKEVENNINNAECDDSKKRKQKKKNKIKEANENKSTLSSETPQNVMLMCMKKKNKQNQDFVVEDVQNAEPSHKSVMKNSKKGDQKAMKRKAADDAPVPSKKKKNNKKKELATKFKKNNIQEKSDNPLSKLSDERLKAYGLNPKKYRSFLKYKKF